MTDTATDIFVFGPLCDAPLRAVVLGADLAGNPAWLADHRIALRAGGDAGLVASPGARADGLLLRGVTPAQQTRLEFYAAALGGRARAVTVAVTDGVQPVPVPALVHSAAAKADAADWDAAIWAAQWASTVRATAGDVMALLGRAPAAALAARYDMMLVRGSARARAAAGLPAALRFASGPQDVQIAQSRQTYANFFAVEEHDLAFRQFGGGMGPVVNRAVFVSGDAVTVLPYDPVRDRVLLVEQFRPGAMARGDGQPWLLEAIAGRVDPGETPEACARREAVEEAGLHLGALLPVANYYPSPGAKTEFLYSYVALVDLPDGVAGVFGMEGEAENIRGHLISFERLMELVTSGEAANAPLILTALWLQRERPRLR